MDVSRDTARRWQAQMLLAQVGVGSAFTPGFDAEVTELPRSARVVVDDAGRYRLTVIRFARFRLGGQVFRWPCTGWRREGQPLSSHQQNYASYVTRQGFF